MWEALTPRCFGSDWIPCSVQSHQVRFLSSIVATALAAQWLQVIVKGRTQSSVPFIMEVEEAFGRISLSGSETPSSTGATADGADVMTDAFNMTHDCSDRLPGSTPRLPAQNSSFVTI